MNAARMRQELLALRARVDELLEGLDKDAAAVNDAAPGEIARLYASPKEYAEMSGVSVTTVRKWIRAGLPVRRRGRSVMIDLERAKGWDLSKEDAKKADRSAHGGKP